MKKSKIILSILLALVLLLSAAMTAACVENIDPGPGDTPGGNDNPGGNDTPGGNDDPLPTDILWELQKITISGAYKTEYQLNESFSTDGLTVSATMTNINTGATRTENVTQKATVDSSRFNSAMVGAYTITISYTHENVTRYADYSVKVLPYEPSINGISMTKTTLDYNIPSGHLTVSVNIDDITVKAVNANGDEEATPLAADAYALSFYKGGQKVDSLENVARGSYTIQAERKSDGQKAFVIVNVKGGVESINASTVQETIELANESATVEINTQDITVNTDNGAVVVADATNGPCIAISYKLYSVADGAETALDTWTVGAGTYKVKVTATYNNPATESTVDFTAEVAITVNVKFVGSRTETYNLDLNPFSDMSDKANLKQSDLTGNNAFLTYVGGTLQYRNAANCIEIKKDSLSVTFEGTGTIAISVRSTSGTNLSALYLKDKNGNYLTATYDTTVTAAGVVAQDKGNVYTIYGSTVCTFTFTITEAGTYTIGNMNVGDTDRSTRIMAIEMIDNIVA